MAFLKGLISKMLTLACWALGGSLLLVVTAAHFEYAQIADKSIGYATLFGIWAFVLWWAKSSISSGSSKKK